MQRTSEIQAEEATPLKSPLRRSCRIVAVSSPAPTEIKTIKGRRLSATNTDDEIVNIQPKSVRTTRASSITKENSETKLENVPTRGRRLSATSEDGKKPATTRSRRSSVTAEEPEKEIAKPVRTRRRSTTTETVEEPEKETAKPVRTRRASATVEDYKKSTKVKNSALNGLEEKKPGRGRRSSLQEDIEETVKKPVTGTRSSVQDEAVEMQQKSTRSRRSVSRDLFEDVDQDNKVKPLYGDNNESQNVLLERKTSLKGFVEITEEIKEQRPAVKTPVKPKRRLSITENVVVLEPIDEQEHQSPNKSPTKLAVRQKLETKTNLDLSVINESSFSEELEVNRSKSSLNKEHKSQNKNLKETDIVDGNDSMNSQSLVEFKSSSAIKLKNESHSLVDIKEASILLKSSKIDSPSKDGTNSIKENETKPTLSELSQNEPLVLFNKLEDERNISEKHKNIKPETVSTPLKLLAGDSLVLLNDGRRTSEEDKTKTPLISEKVPTPSKQSPIESLNLLNVDGRRTPDLPARRSPRLIEKFERCKSGELHIHKKCNCEESPTGKINQKIDFDTSDNVKAVEAVNSRHSIESLNEKKLVITEKKENFKLNDGEIEDTTLTEVTVVAEKRDYVILETLSEVETKETATHFIEAADGAEFNNDKENITEYQEKSDNKKEVLQNVTTLKNKIAVTPVRTSNVFKPKDIEYSYVEPMDIDMTVLGTPKWDKNHFSIPILLDKKCNETLDLSVEQLEASVEIKFDNPKQKLGTLQPNNCQELKSVVSEKITNLEPSTVKNLKVQKHFVSRICENYFSMTEKDSVMKTNQVDKRDENVSLINEEIIQERNLETFNISQLKMSETEEIRSPRTIGTIDNLIPPVSEKTPEATQIVSNFTSNQNRLFFNKKSNLSVEDSIYDQSKDISDDYEFDIPSEEEPEKPDENKCSLIFTNTVSNSELNTEAIKHDYKDMSIIDSTINKVEENVCENKIENKQNENNCAVSNKITEQRNSQDKFQEEVSTSLDIHVINTNQDLVEANAQNDKTESSFKDIVNEDFDSKQKLFGNEVESKFAVHSKTENMDNQRSIEIAEHHVESNFSGKYLDINNLKRSDPIEEKNTQQSEKGIENAIGLDDSRLSKKEDGRKSIGKVVLSGDKAKLATFVNPEIKHKKETKEKLYSQEKRFSFSEWFEEKIDSDDNPICKSKKQSSIQIQNVSVAADLFENQVAIKNKSGFSEVKDNPESSVVQIKERDKKKQKSNLNNQETKKYENNVNSGLLDDATEIGIVQNNPNKRRSRTSLNGSDIKSNGHKNIRSCSVEVADKAIDEQNENQTERKQDAGVVSIERTKTNTSSRQSLAEFTNSRLDEYLARKMLELESPNVSNEESESDNSFVDNMAEEGEEDTPSEDSNEIIDEGESINSDSDRSEEYSDEDNSFICDKEKVELLPGEEYDLEDGPKKKKTRILNVEDRNEDIIKIKKKHSTEPQRKKKSRILNVADRNEDIIKIEKKQRAESPKKKCRIITACDSSSDDEIIEVSSKGESSSNASMDKSSIENKDRDSRRSSINIIENIDLKDIKDAALSERINKLVGSFCTTIPQKGGISMNLSLEYGGDVSSEDGIGLLKKRDSKKNRSSNVSIAENTETKENSKQTIKRKSFDVETMQSKEPRLSVSFTKDLNSEIIQKRKLSNSMNDLEVESKKRIKIKRKSQKQMELSKQLPHSDISSEDFKKKTFGLMNQLLNDVRKRPRRFIRPSTRKLENLNNSWLVEDKVEVKPSTTIITKQEIEEFKNRHHPKDFRNQMLYSSRVKREETKKLLRKKGVYY